MPESDKQSFLADLMTKEAAVRQAGDEAGINVGALVTEAQRQQQEALKGGDPVKGAGVTKSGEDG